jgi:hypothetical protein
VAKRLSASVLDPLDEPGKALTCFKERKDQVESGLVLPAPSGPGEVSTA